MTFILRPYRPDQDGKAVFNLYQSVFGEHWPLDFESFRRVTSEHAFYRPGDHFVAGAEGKITGFAATQVCHPEFETCKTGGIELLVVDPDYRGEGIGRALHNTALEHLRKAGMKTVLLGGGGLLRLWPGIPETMASSLGFFEKQGWSAFQHTCDLVRDVRQFELPSGLRQRMQLEGIDLHPARPEEVPAVLEFEQAHFPYWHREFAYKSSLGEEADILVAWEAGTGVVGTLMMFSPSSKLLSVNLLWKGILGGVTGGLGAVGVAEQARGRSIGIALVSWGSVILKERGVTASMIDWTGLVDFYGKAGYQPWRWYWSPSAMQLDE